MNGGPDHVHILSEADAFTALGSLANIARTKTSRFTRREYGETVLSKYYWKPFFWSDSYYVTTISDNSLAVIRDYIRNQKFLLAFTRKHAAHQLLLMWYSAASLYRILKRKEWPHHQQGLGLSLLLFTATAQAARLSMNYRSVLARGKNERSVIKMFE